MTTREKKNKFSRIRSIEDIPYFGRITTALFIIVGILIYSTAIGTPFIWDDFTLVTENQSIKGWGNFFGLFKGNVVDESSFYRPLQMFSYLLDFELWSLNPKGFHLTSILLHISVALSLCWLIITVFRDRWIGLLAGLLFLVHPVHNEAVVYISGRADPLCALFILLTLIFYIRFETSRSKTDGMAAVLTCILALLSKEYAFVLPILILGYHLVFGKRIKSIVFYALIGITSLYLGLRMFNVLGVADMHSKTQSILIQRLPGTFFAMFEYVRLLILPYDLYLGYGQKIFAWTNPRVMAGAVVYLCMIILAVRLRRKNPLVSFGLCWYLAGLLPVMNFYPINAYLAEHWVYVPSMGIFLIAAWGIRQLYSKLRMRDSLIFGTACIIVVFSMLTVRQNLTWKDPVAFYKRIVEINPRFVKAYNNLGKIYSSQEDFITAGEYFKKTFEIEPRFEKGYHNYAVCLAKQFRYDEAIKFYQRALSINPNFAATYNNLGALFLDREKYDLAEQYVNKALSLEPDIPKAYYNLGLIEQKRGNEKKSAEYFKKAVQLDPQYVAAQNNLGAVLSHSGKTDTAIDHYLESLKNDPDNYTALNNIGILYGQKGDIEKSIEYFAKALGVKSDFADAHFNIAFAFAKRKSLGQAMRHYQDAIKYNPRHIQAINNLAIIYAGQGRLADAEQLFNKVLELDGSDESTHNNLGLILAKQKKYDQARIHYEKVIELNPNHKEVHNNLAMLFDHLGRMQEAEDHYIKALQLDPEFTNALNGLGIVYGKAKRYKDAENMFIKALEVNPNGKDALNNLQRARMLIKEEGI